MDRQEAATIIKAVGKHAIETHLIRAMSYKESRIEHFKAVREKRKKTLHWWKYQKPYKQYDAQTIHGMCTDLGREISYLDDVIAMLERTEVEG